MKIIESLIQWTDITANFWVGCTPVSAACRGCYMFRDATRYGFNGSVVRRSSDATFYAPLKIVEPKRIFTCSWSDFFHEAADSWRKDAWDVIRMTPWHTWMILTKRPERIASCLPPDWGNGYKNVWLGTSVENNRVVHRIETLRKIPAKIRFISAEPLLEDVDFGSLAGFHWMIIGGDSGNDKGKDPRFNYRPCELSWLENAVDQAKGAGLATFVKQLGTDQFHRLNMKRFDARDRHAGKMEFWPEHLKIREFPTAA